MFSPKKLEIVVYRFNRVLFGLTSSPFLLNATIAFHLMMKLKAGIDVDIIKKLLRNLYVDDSPIAVNDVKEGAEFYDKAKLLLLEAGFNLRKWETNDPELRNIVSEKHETMDDVIYVEDIFGMSKKYRKVLGINWDTLTDELITELYAIADEGLKLAVTKRNILKVGASYFDPIGLICPIVLQVKLIFKQLCSMKVDWDSIVSESILTTWRNYLNELKNVNEIRIPRYINKNLNDEIVSCELHGFADSSKDAYAGLVYLRCLTSVGDCKINLISAKSKVAPAKMKSIPRLELMSCLLLSKLLYAVKEALKYKFKAERIVCWSDSEVSLYWIKSLRREWKPWVERRVTNIRDVTDTQCWRHVPGSENPADLATRFGRINTLITEKWWFGHEFLKNEENWPEGRNFSSGAPKECFDEFRK